MNAIQSIKQHQQQQLKIRAKQVIQSIEQKTVFFTENKLSTLIYTLNDHRICGVLPILSSIQEQALKRYVIRQLIKKGYRVQDVSTDTEVVLYIQW